MKKLTVFSFILVLVACFSGCVAIKQTQLTPDNRICATNFAYDGSFFAGRTFKTFQDFPKVNKERAFERALEFVVSDGWQIISSNKSQGIISASQSVSFGKGATVPLNIFVKPLSRNGSKVSINYSTPGGVSSPVDAVRDTFCSILAAVAQQN